ncbi:electron transport complex subunit RsxC [Vibrio sp. 11986-1-5]|uniref:electron transport complex subunit RsxC n=1 Tax=Vibrio sp. 11986-1-5 TaxID=2211215 RepID=UPI000D735B8B|nr:electron transport complex subunit RsxC [Vibrio sp. 11986-1-5]PXA71072.1 electron transport complex subunit RsxC [Vibrio sp. 11986-1-5]
MLSLIEQIQAGRLWDFPGGIHPPENKQQSMQTAIASAPLASELVLPIKQHIGKAGDLLVEVGQTVLKGQPLTQYSATFMLPVHAPTSGIITAIEPRTIAHPSGLQEMCIVIRPDGHETWIERECVTDFTQHSAEQLIEIIRQAGVSGMGGAGFPTAKKIQTGLSRTEILIINAAECEPYITADDALMRYHADEIIQGISIVEHILQPKLTIIAIEDNKPEAVRALEAAAKEKDLLIRVIPTKYPSGGEKQLIKILTNLEVPNNGIPADIGIMMQNIGSVHAIKRAVIDGEPLIQRIVTLTGNTFKQPTNVWTLLGTPVAHLLEKFAYQADKKLPRLIMGGPMMGFTLPHAQVPITKTSNCILAPTSKEIRPPQTEMACIRCSLCADACPASLLPQQLQWHAKAEEYDKCEELNLKDCIECGACAYVCPSEIPLVQYYRQAKAEIRARKREAEAAERAKLRFEEKKARMERDKAEREQRFKQAAEDRRKEMQNSGSDDAIAAAIARVKAQKQQEDSNEKAVKPAVAAAIARAKAKQAEARQSVESPVEEDSSPSTPTSAPAASTTNDDKKDAVAAAIARAKTRKAALQDASADDSSPATSPAPKPAASAPSDDKKDAVAAAIARAKARKAALKEVSADDSSPATSPAPKPAASAPSDDKKDAVAAAIARAKARKAALQEASADDSSPATSPAPKPTASAPSDDKKDAVAAAIARAKARKAALKEVSADDLSPATSPAPKPTASAPNDDKKDAVAAAIARAKARKAALQDASADDSSPATSPSPKPAASAPSDDKKDAVAAAIARAKARKAALQTNHQANNAEEKK